MRNYLRSAVIGFVFGVAGLAAAGTTIPYFTGPQDPGSLFKDLNTLIQTLNAQLASYITFNQTAAEQGMMAFTSNVVVSGTSIKVVLPSGAERYIQTSASP